MDTLVGKIRNSAVRLPSDIVDSRINYVWHKRISSSMINDDLITLVRALVLVLEGKYKGE